MTCGSPRETWNGIASAMINAKPAAASGVSRGRIRVRAGFFDQSHFAKVFKQHMGMTPAQFRSAAGARNSRTKSHRAS